MQGCKGPNWIFKFNICPHFLLSVMAGSPSAIGTPLRIYKTSLRSYKVLVYLVNLSRSTSFLGTWTQGMKRSISSADDLCSSKCQQNTSPATLVSCWRIFKHFQPQSTRGPSIHSCLFWSWSSLLADTCSKRNCVTLYTGLPHWKWKPCETEVKWVLYLTYKWFSHDGGIHDNPYY